MPSRAPTPTDRTAAPAHRTAAARVVAGIADRLAEPERVARIAGVPDNVMRYPGAPQPVWDPLLLNDGHPGVALLFAELAVGEPELRGRAHAHLSAALAAGIRLRPQSLFGGMVALAYAGHTAAVGSGGYATMLSGLDRHITEQARERAHADLERTRAGEPVGAWSRYDVLGGTAGIGRYLLARHEAADGQAARETAGAALTEVLTSLVAAATADDVTRHGTRLSAWWVTDGLEHGLVEHVNFGLAHGVTGPLALLSTAWRAGVRVDRQDEAIERIMALLSSRRMADAHGPRWPHLVNLAHIESGEGPERGRDSWCYGAAGAARAVHLAGLALDRADWRADAHAALRGALDAASEELIRDSALCHGWAGLLQIVLRMAHDSAGEDYRADADRLAARVVDGFDPEAPFGFRYAHVLAARELDRPGFLEGAAGIALALHTYATGNAPATPWDGALLLS
ncbi:lanthionine synthetase C family protein [Streptomyces sp. C11-1]|uniref:Lanthionine synthetase C family protein n=1 Tax=Streptomyces durocortorensis TaxID=2811104 RepID=A0ABY9VPB5_9ACTN|nr:lanthionine synthetase C family protein [Streptomyces durocortorensis]WNF25608.1 lanthionine synthetase C family protein [Streptomyces durocortorensis]